MHTNVAVFIVLEMVISFRKYPLRKKAVTGLLIFNICYVIWILIIKYKSDKWVYPVLDVLNLPQRVGFITFMGIFGISFYFVGEYLNSKIWAFELKTTKASSSSKKHK